MNGYKVMRTSSRLLQFFTMALLFFSCSQPIKYFHIQVVDKETKRGIPIAKVSTIARVDYYSDSNGNIAFFEKDFMDKEVYFVIEAEGYRFPKDSKGASATPMFTKVGGKKVLELERTQAAERLYRVTGSGIYRDTDLLELPSPIKDPNWSKGNVVGQDSNIGIVHNGKAFFIWGDTFLPPKYEGNFSVAAATAELPESGGMDPNKGISLNYIVDEKGMSRSMIDLDGPGYVWFDWLMHVADDDGNEVLAAKYARVNAFFGNYERGVAIYNEENQIFEKVEEVEEWKSTQGHTCHHVFKGSVGGKEEYYLTAEFALSKVTPSLSNVSNPEKYLHFTCLKENSGWESNELDRQGGELNYGWKSGTKPTDVRAQKSMIEEGIIDQEEGWLQFTDVQTGELIDHIGRGSIYWNEYRQKWIFIGGHTDTWYSEADTPVGPWHYAVKVADHYNFLYNPKQHDFLDQDGGRVVFFEGTYTKFLGPKPTVPRYDYNQIMYRLQLDDPRLTLPAPVYRVGDQLKFGKDLIPEEWDQVKEIAFFAVEEKKNGLAALYNKGDELSLDPSDNLAFVGVENDVARMNSYPGKWDVTVGFESFDNFFRATISTANGVELSSDKKDFEVSDAAFKGDSLYFVLKHEGGTYRLSGLSNAGTIEGKWIKDGTSLTSTWSAEKTSSGDWWPMLNGRLVSLFLAKNQRTDKIAYMVETDLTEEWVASGNPICKVWESPFRYLPIDPSIKPVQDIL